MVFMPLRRCNALRRWADGWFSGGPDVLINNADGQVLVSASGDSLRLCRWGLLAGHERPVPRAAEEPADLTLGWESGIGTTGQYPRQDLIPGNMDEGFHHRDDEAVLGVRATRVSG
jgi:hypothetical protein